MNRYLNHVLTLYKDKQLSQDAALSLIAEYKHQHSSHSEQKNHKIAVIGMSARMPLANNCEEFWNLLVKGTNCVRSFPESRRKDIDPLAEQIPDKQFVKGKRYWVGGFLEEVDKFDHEFFEILPADALVMDPQQRLFLEMAFEAFQDAGYTREQLRHSNTGIYLGDVMNEYHKIVPRVTTSAVVGNVSPFITSRVSYYYDLHGPTVNISTTCSTSLVAVHAACQALLNGECEMALAGAINLRLFPFALKDDPVDALGITTEDGFCRAFDNQANGIVRGEGGGAFVLKPYEKAIHDGDRIHAVILGSAVNNDGRSSSAGAPNPLAQEKLLQSAWEKSRIDPRTIQYIEAHGTGTKIGDPIEVNGINRAFAAYTNEKNFCGLGSVKTNLGHLTGGASGIAGLLKTILSLKNRQIPATLHFKTPNEFINFSEASVYITDKLLPWPSAEIKRAGVSAFGFNGTNCHMVLEEGNEIKPENTEKEVILLLSHKTEKGLKIQLERFHAYLEEHRRELSVVDVCFTMAVCRDHFKERCAVIAQDMEDLLEKLSELKMRDKVAGAVLGGQHAETVALAHQCLTHSIDWKTFFGKRHNKVSLPTYFFERKRFWIEGARYGIEFKQGHLEDTSVDDAMTALESICEKDIAQHLIAIFRSVMGLENIQLEDNFFNLGGDSLLGIQLINEIHKRFNKKLSYQDLFANPRLIDLAILLKKKDEQLFQGIRKLQEQKEYPLSFGQRRLWILHQMQDDPVAYNMYEAYQIEEELDFVSFQQALDSLVERHAALKMVFLNHDGIPSQSFSRLKRFPLTLMDLSSAQQADQKAQEYLEKYKRMPFDLEKGPLIRGLLVQTAPNRHIFLFVMHHIISDGWSVRLMVQDLLKAYDSFKRKESWHPSPLKISYHDYAHWQHQVLSEHRFMQMERYWLEKFKGVLPVCEILGDQPRPAVFHFKGARQTFQIPTPLVEHLTSIANQQNATLFMSLLTALYIYIHKYTNQQDLIVGTPVSGRSHLDLKSIVGFFVNTLSLRFFLDPAKNFVELLAQVKDDTLKALENQDYPFDLLVDKLKLRRDTSRSPLFNINVAFQNFELDDSSNAIKERLKVTSIPLKHHSCKWDLEFEFVKQSDGSILAYLEYYTGIYSEAMIHSMIGNFLGLLTSVVQMPKVSAEKIRMQQESAHLTSSNPSVFISQPLHTSFERVAAASPHSPAIKHLDISVSYEELNEKANQVAHFLKAYLSLANEELVGIFMENSPFSIIAILAILKAGGAYVPVDVKWPKERQKAILDEAEIRIVLTTQKQLTFIDNLQWSCPSFKSYLCLDAENLQGDFGLATTSLMDVQLWNHVAEQSTDEITASGWISSYTGLPFTKAEMDEYQQNVLAKLRPLLSKNTRVLEIGCGSGLTAFALAPYVKAYLGTDLSTAIIAQNRAKAASLRENNLRFEECLADQIDQLEGTFDVVIINSVIHCFPGYAYLKKVIKKSIEKCSDKAVLFLGDLMDQELKEQLEQSFREFKQDHLGRGYRTKTDWSRELFVSRSFIEDLQSDFSSITKVKCAKKIHTLENELTRFRYDALLMIDKKQSTSKTQKHKSQYSLENLKDYAKTNLDLLILPSNLAYVIFTSGSTGKPKGVMVEHGTVWNYIQWAISSYFRNSTEKPCFAFYSPLTFDLTVTSVFCPLFTGSYLRVLQGEFDEVLQGLLQHSDCNILKLTPTHLSMLIETKQPIPSVRKFILGGEALYGSIVNALYDLYKDPIQIYNEYGPTETTVGCIVYESSERSPTDHAIPIGTPMAHITIHLLNDKRHPVPIGAVGEIYIAGYCLARGYLNQPAMTSERFLDNGLKPEERMYKTGDLGRCLPNGVIEYLGRNDRQVKIKGHRIELNEIEAILYKHPQVNFCAVAVKEDLRGKVICAYYTSEHSLASQDLREFVQRELPESMIPGHFICLTEMPLSTNGKIDYLTLPEPFIERERKFCSLPTNETEKNLLELWAQVLGMPKETICIEDDFFDLGGDSIMAMRLLPKLKELGMTLSIKEIFQYRTIRAIALYARSKTNTPSEPIAQDEVVGNVLLTPIQEWFFEHQMKHPEFFNMSHLFCIPDDVDELLLEKALRGCITHHDMLRTSYQISSKGIEQRVVKDHAVSFKLLRKSLAGLSTQEQQSRMHAISDDLQSSFDLGKPPLIKAIVIDLGLGQKRLLIVVHHLVFDGVSWRYLVEDLESLYFSKLNEKLPLKTHSFQKWSQSLAETAGKKSLNIDYWLNIDTGKSQSIVEIPGSDYLVKNYEQKVLTLPSYIKDRLFAFVCKEYNMNDLLLSSLFLALCDVCDVNNILINHEGHGRSGCVQIDVSRTLGWFTSIYPIYLEKQKNVKQTLKFVCETLRKMNGIDSHYGIARYLQNNVKLKQFKPEILFNYFGRVGADLLHRKKSLLTDCEQLLWQTSHACNKMPHSLEVNAIATEEFIRFSFMYDRQSYHEETINQLMNKFQQQVESTLGAFSKR